MTRSVLLLGLSMLTPLGCAPTYAPPIRTVHGGAPGRLDPGDMEVGLGSSGGSYVPAGMGGGTVGYAARPHLTVEGGIDGGEAWTMGWGGVRVPTRIRLRPSWLSAAFDGEAGVGIGIGGECGSEEQSCHTDGLQWYQRMAGGGYLGAGAALRMGPISLFGRGRLQVAGAQRIPTTQWASAMGGLHTHILRYADLWAGVAAVRYSNETESLAGVISEVGLAFRFDPHLGWR